MDFFKRLLIVVPAEFVVYLVLKGLYDFMGGFFFWVLCSPAVCVALYIGIDYLFDFKHHKTSKLDSVYWDVYTSGDPYRIAKYEAAREQERKLEEINNNLAAIKNNTNRNN